MVRRETRDGEAEFLGRLAATPTRPLQTSRVAGFAMWWSGPSWVALRSPQITQNAHPRLFTPLKWRLE